MIVVNHGRAAQLLEGDSFLIPFHNTTLTSRVQDLDARLHWNHLGPPTIEQQALCLTMEFLLTSVYLQSDSHFLDLLQSARRFNRDPMVHMILSLEHKFNLVPENSDAGVLDQMEECEQIL